MRKTLQQLQFYDKYFYYARGKSNAITDVPGVKVGHTTLIQGDSIRTGVTAVIPPDIVKSRYPAASFAFNGNGEVSGLAYINEEARLISPILLTNTLALPKVCQSLIRYYHRQLALPVVGECWDGTLNDINTLSINYSHVVEALESASSGKVLQGNVGAGTGMTTFGFKGGIGTSSRIIHVMGNKYHIGVLVNNNMNSEAGNHRYLRLAGLEVSRLLGEQGTLTNRVSQTPLTQTNSSILIVATDAPLISHQLQRFCRHAVLGFARLGYVSYSGSGDFVIAFSTGNVLHNRLEESVNTLTKYNEASLDIAFEALIEAVEEAYLNSMLCAQDMVGYQGQVAKALPIDKLLPLLQ